MATRIQGKKWGKEDEDAILKNMIGIVRIRLLRSLRIRECGPVGQG